MKVLHLIDSGGLYGAERILLGLTAEQRRNGVDASILSAGDTGVGRKPLEEEAKRLGIPIIPWRMKPGMNFPEALRIRNWALEAGFAILHSHGYKFDILLNAIPKTSVNYKIVSTVHGYTATSLFSKLWLYRLLDRLFLRLSDGVCVVSQDLRKTFHGYPNVYFIPNGIEENGYIEPCNNEFSNDYLISVGRLSREKGVDNLLKAFSELKVGLAPPCLMIVGDGPEKESLVELAQTLGISGSVLFKGYVKDATCLISNARALVISSTTEGLPLTLLEAMRSKTPVIATPVGEIPTVLNNGAIGYLARNTDWRDLVTEIERCCGNSNDNEELTDQAFKLFMENYTTKVMEARYREFYEHVSK